MRAAPQSLNKWTPDKVRTLIELWEFGTEAKIIARKIDMEPQQVFMKRHALGLPPRIGQGKDARIGVVTYLTEDDHNALVAIMREHRWTRSNTLRALVRAALQAHRKDGNFLASALLSATGEHDVQVPHGRRDSGGSGGNQRANV